MKVKTLYKYRLIIILAVIAGSMALIKWQYKDRVWVERAITFSPTPIPTIAPHVNDSYPLWEFIPYLGNGFKIDHYEEAGVLVVKINEEVDEIEVQEEVYNWMRENKVATESHKLIFEKE